MRKSVKKAPTIVGFEVMMGVAIKASELVNAAGFGDLVAVPAKRSVQWRVKFKSEKRAKNADKRKLDTGSTDSFSVSKHVVFTRLAKAGVSYDAIMSEAYASQGLVFRPTYAEGSAPVVTEKVKKVKAKAPKKVKAEKVTKVKAKKVSKAATKETKAVADVSDAELEAMLSEMLA